MGKSRLPEELAYIELDTLRKELSSSEAEWTDEDLVQLFEVYIVSYNAEGAAFNYFNLLAVVCYYRPYLTEKLLKKPMYVAHFLGITSAKEVIEFVNYHFDRIAWGSLEIWINYFPFFPHKYFPSDLIGQEGRYWLKQVLPTLGEMIQSVLDEVISQKDME